jgi:DNA repair protein RadC
MKRNENLLNESVAEVALVYRSKIRPSERLQVICSRQMASIFRSVWSADNIELLEECKVMYLNKGNRVLAIYPLSQGGISSTVVDIKLIMVGALRLNATQICICHNHPSGTVRPSEADRSLTVKIQAASVFMDIRLIDHIIITKDSYYSMSDQGDI